MDPKWEYPSGYSDLLYTIYMDTLIAQSQIKQTIWNAPIKRMIWRMTLIYSDRQVTVALYGKFMDTYFSLIKGWRLQSWLSKICHNVAIIISHNVTYYVHKNSETLFEFTRNFHHYFTHSLVLPVALHKFHSRWCMGIYRQIVYDSCTSFYIHNQMLWRS